MGKYYCFSFFFNVFWFYFTSYLHQAFSKLPRPDSHKVHAPSKLIKLNLVLLVFLLFISLSNRQAKSNSPNSLWPPWPFRFRDFNTIAGSPFNQVAQCVRSGVYLKVHFGCMAVDSCFTANPHPLPQGCL